MEKPVSQRYRFLRTLGRGGMGEVQLVHDMVRQQQVAKKSVLHSDADAMLRFKREFRLIEQLLHPNLVRLYELGEEPDGLFFTMEVIDGVDLTTYCTGGEFPPFDSDRPVAVAREQKRELVSDPLAPTVERPVDEEHLPSSRVTRPVNWDRLAHVLPQLLEALAVLHGHGLVHRDLKPGNIMVRRDGAVKLLDFGVLAELGPSRLDDGQEVLGTVGYMAPEQLSGGPPTSASDLYALGALLFELISGRPVFDGTFREVICQHLAADVPLLSNFTADAPPALVDACAGLLQKKPDQRPSLRDLARQLLPALNARIPVFPLPRPSRPALVGREQEQQQISNVLKEAQQGRFRLLALSGPTGSGKTALAAWLAEIAEREGMTVLRGRGRPSEQVAFNALDRCIDDLATVIGRRRLRKAPPELERILGVAASAFPVLGLRSLDVSPRQGASRAAVFSAVVQLLTREATQSRGLVLLMDDLQWADEDSVAFLDHLVDDAPSSVLVLTTLRDDVGPTAASRWLERRDHLLRLEVSPLADGAIEAIIQRCAREAGAEPEQALLRSAVGVCAGHPYLAELAGRTLARTGKEVHGGAVHTALASLVASVPLPSRELLALLIAADGWTAVDDLARWCPRPVGEVLDYLVTLETEGLIRVAGNPGLDRVADLYHSAVRESAMEVLGSDSLRRAHGSIVAHLEQDPTCPPRRLVRHLLGAGRPEEAARRAPDAARQAEAQRAYALAAEMYSVALRHPGDQRADLLSKRAVALERAAQYHEAARTWSELTRVVEDEEARADAMLREAHARLATGDLVLGRQHLERALAVAGEPAPGRGGLAGWIAGMGFLRGPPRRSPGRAGPNPAKLAEAERDIRLGQLVTYFDPLAGIRFLRRARKGFVQVGAVEQAAWCDYVFAYLALFGSRRRGPVPLAQRYLDSAAALVGNRPPELFEVRMMPDFLKGVAAQRDGRWADGVAALDRVAALVDQEGILGTFEHMMVLVHRCQIDLYSHNMKNFASSLASFRTAAMHTGDSAIRCHLGHLDIFQAIYRGKLQLAADLATELTAEWQVEQPSFQRFIVRSLHSIPQIYLSDCRQERQRMSAALKEARAFRPLRTMYGGHFGAYAALVEATALRSGDPQASARRCHRYAKLAEWAVPLGTSAAWRALAYAADATGHPEQAIALLSRGQQEAEQFGQRIDSAICTYQRGLRIKGDQGATLVQTARQIFDELGIAHVMLQEDLGLR